MTVLDALAAVVSFSVLSLRQVTAHVSSPVEATFMPKPVGDQTAFFGFAINRVAEQ